jgi:hypothetical protein
MMDLQDLQAWAVPRLQTLLPLDEDSLRQIVEFAAKLSREAAGNHFTVWAVAAYPLNKILTVSRSSLENLL